MSTNAHEIIEEIQAKAFQNGWNALAQKIMEAMNVSAPLYIKKTYQKKSPGNYRPDSTAHKVYTYVKNNPGLTAAEIVKNENLEDKTARTALHRMKIKGVAVNEEGRWRIV